MFRHARTFSTRSVIEALEERRLLAGEPWGAFPLLIDQNLHARDYPAVNGSGFSVAILDTGVDYNHPGLGAGFGAGHKVIAGYDFVDNDADPMDADGHGTGVAGSAAGYPFVYNGAKYQGIAPEANIIALRTEDGSDEFDADAGRIHQALQWILAHRTQYNIVAVNISTGSGLYSSAFSEGPCGADFAALAAAGVFVAASAGNDGVTSPPSVEYPAADPNVYAVGSINVNGGVSSWSSRASIMDLLAPGENVPLSYYVPATHQHIYIAGSGTSFASPAVAGLAVLLKQIDPTLTPGEMLSIMQTSGVNVYDGATGLTFKRIDIDNALALTYTRRDDAYEDNDATSTATTLAFSNYSASLSNLKLLIGADDYYRFTIDRSCDVALALDVNGTGTTPAFKLLDSGGSLLANLGTSGTQRLAAGTYYLRVAAGSASLIGSYDLSVGLTPDDAYEQNDSTSTATPITFSGESFSLDQLRLLGGDADYFGMVLDRTTGLKIDVSVSGGGSPVFELLNASGSKIADVAGDTAIQVAAGTYYVRATSGSTLPGTYGFALTRTIDDSYENNDTLAAATPMLINGGHGGLSDLRLLGGDADYYSFTLASAGNITVALDYAGPSPLPAAELLDASGRQIAAMGSGATTQQLGAAKYVIHVSASQFVQGSYGITVGAAALPAPSFTGTSNDLAYDSSGTLHFAFFDTNSTTLKYATRSSEGIWSAAQTVDATNGAGQFVSLAIDGSDRPGVAYYDAVNGDLKYAHYNGSAWSAQTVDSFRTVGLYPSLAYDLSGTAVITYYHKTYADLRFAVWGGSAWAISTIDSSNDVGRYSSLALSPQGQWSVAYENTTGGYFKFAQKRKSGWGITVVDTTRSGGGYCSLAFDGAGQPAFSYYDAWNADLKFAHYNGSKWQTQTVASKNSQGLYANLYFAPASLQARIVYYNRSGDGVYLATGNIGSWTFQQLASGGGSSVAATPGVSQDCTFAWMQTATGRLVIEDW